MSNKSCEESLQEHKARIKAKAHRAHMLTCLAGARAMLSHLFYGQATHEHSAWMCSYGNNHHAGGVMDHLASLIDALETKGIEEGDDQ